MLLMIDNYHHHPADSADARCRAQIAEILEVSIR